MRRLARRLLNGVLIANDRKCFIACKLLDRDDLNAGPCRIKNFIPESGAVPGKTPQDIGVLSKRSVWLAVHGLRAPDDADVIIARIAGEPEILRPKLTVFGNTASAV